MKKAILGLGVIIGLSSCGGFTDDQGKAAEDLCGCMESDQFGDFDINWAECETALKVTYSTEVFEEGSWLEALEEKCPDVAEKIK